MLLSFSSSNCCNTVANLSLRGEILRASKIVSGANAALARRTAAVVLLKGNVNVKDAACVARVLADSSFDTCKLGFSTNLE
jgi:hypothetical protein